MAGGSEKTEQATPKRRKDERKKGNVFMSQEIITLVSLLAVVFTIQALGTLLMNALTGTFSTFWGAAGSLNALAPSDLQSIFVEGALAYGIAALPPLLVAGLIGILGTMAQTRGLVSGESMKPKFSRLNPLQGIKKVFSMRGIMELLKALLKIIVLGYVIYNQYIAKFSELPRLMEMSFTSVLAYASGFIMDIITSVAVIFAFLAAFDYMFQRWQYEKDLRMTKQEIKEEYKQTEGDPQIKGQIRERQRAMSRSRMMQQVPEADVVIRNPTHYAVAIKYDGSKNHAPMVLAKGADLMALRIVKVAEENGVMVIENRPLARGLYNTVPLDREIPEEFFQTVAEVLAFVYSTQKKRFPGGMPH